MARIYINAAIATLGLALVLLGLFSMWSNKSAGMHGTQKVDLLETLESQGMIDFELPVVGGADGAQFQLKSLEGKKFILNFWASWCGPCVDEFPSMINLMKIMGDDIYIVAVSADRNQEDIHEFLKLFPEAKTLKNLIVVWDKDLSVGRSYQADRLPESYVVSTSFKKTKKVAGSIKWDTDDAIEYMKSVQ